MVSTSRNDNGGSDRKPRSNAPESGRKNDTAGGGGVGPTTLKNFKQLALLGEGAYSAVYKILRLGDNKIYALKKVKLPSLSEKEKQNSLNEVRLL